MLQGFLDPGISLARNDMFFIVIPTEGAKLRSGGIPVGGPFCIYLRDL